MAFRTVPAFVVFPRVDFTTVVPFDALDIVVLVLTSRLCVRVPGREGGALRGLLYVVGPDFVELVGAFVPFVLGAMFSCALVFCEFASPRAARAIVAVDSLLAVALAGLAAFNGEG